MDEIDVSLQNLSIQIGDYIEAANSGGLSLVTMVTDLRDELSFIRDALHQLGEVLLVIEAREKVRAEMHYSPVGHVHGQGGEVPASAFRNGIYP